jgi:hypothetical protein
MCLHCGKRSSYNQVKDIHFRGCNGGVWDLVPADQNDFAQWLKKNQVE